MAWSYPDVQPFRPLEFEDCHTPRRTMGGNEMQCVWVGLAAIAIVYLLSQQQQQRRFSSHEAFVRRPMDAIAGMIAAVSAKASNVEVMTLKGEKPTPEEMEKATKAIERANESGTYVVYYHDKCGHCKNLIDTCKKMNTKAIFIHVECAPMPIDAVPYPTYKEKHIDPREMFEKSHATKESVASAKVAKTQPTPPLSHKMPHDEAEAPSIDFDALFRS